MPAKTWFAIVVLIAACGSESPPETTNRPASTAKASLDAPASAPTGRSCSDGQEALLAIIDADHVVMQGIVPGKALAAADLPVVRGQPGMIGPQQDEVDHAIDFTVNPPSIPDDPKRKNHDAIATATTPLSALRAAIKKLGGQTILKLIVKRPASEVLDDILQDERATSIGATARSFESVQTVDDALKQLPGRVASCPDAAAVLGKMIPGHELRQIAGFTDAVRSCGCAVNDLEGVVTSVLWVAAPHRDYATLSVGDSDLDQPGAKTIGDYIKATTAAQTP